ncbi:MAG: hypothetical protein A2286_10955 [Gammaproteobacteria bacterium RIFOXYA12_FULL_61_12]|nr:MAG: hypothetical protein A2514_04760 [Gammaproteobacteria bacterium RIFOXYD12_FULL_61_37]OGT89719.1 MAG: hypothetical protein A2286_10955 [Gammaproteobacteria bacterium RIFOXYA12_FULL_61_12]
MKRILFYAVAASFLLQSGFVDASQPPSQTPVVDREIAEKNCRMEGQGEGLAGEALESFVKECVKDLLEVQIENKVKL